MVEAPGKLSLVNSHLSGELTTLLFNSVFNLAASECQYQERAFKDLIDVKLRRVVGDDRIETYSIRNSKEFQGKEYDFFRDMVFSTIQKTGHVANPSKTVLGFGFCEYRQTHALRGVLIPKDQIAILLSSAVGRMSRTYRVFVLVSETP